MGEAADAHQHEDKRFFFLADSNTGLSAKQRNEIDFQMLKSVSRQPRPIVPVARDLARLASLLPAPSENVSLHRKGKGTCWCLFVDDFTLHIWLLFLVLNLEQVCCYQQPPKKDVFVAVLVGMEW
mmetsp:Transcript_33325/g.76780  ORF Transcript_33325/g.76780 Transcript_33325/m.76780 type:complete len:125 (-) Transcript_33325:162-536(-)